MRLEDVVKDLKKKGYRRVFVQYPEGIKRKMLDFASSLKKEGIEAVLCLEYTYGACDLREYEAGLMKCDALLHVGHEDFGVKANLPVYYVDWFIDADPIKCLEKNFSQLNGYENIGLVTSVQFVHMMKPVREWLEAHGKKCFSATSQQYEGQMLGCRVQAGKKIEDKVDCFLCIGAGKFYGLGLALETDKPMLNLDIEMNRIHDMSDLRRKIQKVTAWNLSAVKHANVVGLLVTWKRGQMFGSPYTIKRLLEKKGKTVYVFAFDELSIPKLEGLKVDAMISFGCPRIATDDLDKYKVPLINFTELIKDGYLKEK
jgi:2-(3-amino-3-carboxypropyl)histidine synthase